MIGNYDIKYFVFSIINGCPSTQIQAQAQAQQQQKLAIGVLSIL
jgi:hypothetical protein